MPSVRVLTPKSSSKSLKDALVRKKSESTLIIPTISVTPAEGDEPEPKGRRDSFLAAQEAIAAARGVLSGNVTALDSEGADEPLNGSPSGLGKGRRGRRGRRIKPKPLVNFDEEKLAAHGSHSHGMSWGLRAHSQPDVDFCRGRSRSPKYRIHTRPA